LLQGELVFAAFNGVLNATIQSNPNYAEQHRDKEHLQCPFLHNLYFFHFFKEQYSLLAKNQK